MAEDKNLNNNDLNAADELAKASQEQQPVEYTDDNIRHLNALLSYLPPVFSTLTASTSFP